MEEGNIRCYCEIEEGGKGNYGTSEKNPEHERKSLEVGDLEEIEE